MAKHRNRRPRPEQNRRARRAQPRRKPNTPGGVSRPSTNTPPTLYRTPSGRPISDWELTPEYHRHLNTTRPGGHSATALAALDPEKYRALFQDYITAQLATGHLLPY